MDNIGRLKVLRSTNRIPPELAGRVRVSQTLKVLKNRESLTLEAQCQKIGVDIPCYI